MNIIKKLIKKLIERRTGEPENLIVSIDPSKVFKPERYYESIMTSFNETGCFTVHSADCMLAVLNEGKNLHAVSEHFNLDPLKAIRYGWYDLSQIKAFYDEVGWYVIRFCAPFDLHD